MDPSEVEDSDSDSTYENVDSESGQQESESSLLDSESQEDFDDTDSHYTKSDSDESYISDIDLDAAYDCIHAPCDTDDSDEEGTGASFLRQHTKPFVLNTTDPPEAPPEAFPSENGTHHRWQELNSLILMNDGHGIVDWVRKHDISLEDKRKTKGIFSPLYRAARCGSVSIFNFLLGEGFPHSSVMFSLVDAARNYSVDIMERLVELGADVNSSDSSGFAALHAVAREETYRPRKTQFLLSKVANIDQQDEEGMTALHYAVLMGCRGNVLELLRAGASVNLLTWKGRPVLHMAVYRGMKMVAILYKAGARPGLSSSYCEIEAAVKTQNMNVLRFLIKRNAPLRRPQTVLTSSVVSHSRCGDSDHSMLDVINLFVAAGGEVGPSVVTSFAMDACDFCSGSKLDTLLSSYHNARSLQDTCCLRIRDCFQSCTVNFSESVQQLSIPDLLKDYVKFNHLTEMTSKHSLADIL